MKLPDSDRRAVAICLLDSVGDEPPEEIDRAWIGAARRRLADIHAGRSETAPWEVAKARIFDRTR
jgi:putative addiction module component (TIGR02574 family)